MSAPGWPASAAHGDVVVRPLRLSDAAAWVELRRRNAAWLAPWEATPPYRRFDADPTWSTFAIMQRTLRRQARAGAALPFAVEYAGRLVGQVTVGNIVRASLN